MSSMTNFTKTIRSNNIRPPNGALPLNVVEFSLTHETRDKIKQALEPFIKNQIKNTNELSAIFLNPENFPQQIIGELRDISKIPGEETTAYIIRNLPEIDAELIPKNLRPVAMKNDLQQWLKENSYSTYMAEGIGGAATLPHMEHEFVTARHSGDKVINGEAIHKHGFPLGSINVITTDGAPTRLIDMRTVLGEVEKNNELGKILIDVAPGNAALRGQALERISLWQLKDGEHALPSSGPDIAFQPIAEHANKFQALVRRHSLDIVGHKGDMVIWPDDGLIFHQAIAKDSTINPGDLSRAVTVRALGKQTQAPVR